MIVIFTSNPLRLLANTGHAGHLQKLCPSGSMQPQLITNKRSLFRATNRLPGKTALGTLKSGDLSWLKQHSFVIFRHVLASFP